MDYIRIIYYIYVLLYTACARLLFVLNFREKKMYVKWFVLLYYCITVLLYHYTTILLYYYINIAIVPYDYYYPITTLRYYYITI